MLDGEDDIDPKKYVHRLTQWQPDLERIGFRKRSWIGKEEWELSNGRYLITVTIKAQDNGLVEIWIGKSGGDSFWHGIRDARVQPEAVLASVKKYLWTYMHRRV